jgi:hypothetical protein
MDERWLNRVEKEVNDPSQDKYLVARGVGRDLQLSLLDKPLTLSDDEYAALGASFLEVLQRHKLILRADDSPITGTLEIVGQRMVQATIGQVYGDAPKRVENETLFLHVRAPGHQRVFAVVVPEALLVDLGER